MPSPIPYTSFPRDVTSLRACVQGAAAWQTKQQAGVVTGHVTHLCARSRAAAAWPAAVRSRRCQLFGLFLTRRISEVRQPSTVLNNMPGHKGAALSWPACRASAHPKYCPVIDALLRMPGSALPTSPDTYSHQHWIATLPRLWSWSRCMAGRAASSSCHRLRHPPVCTEPAGSCMASCCATAPMPAAGRQFSPVARQRMTNSNRREVVLRPRSKKMPPRKGRKKRSMIAAEKPSACASGI